MKLSLKVGKPLYMRRKDEVPLSRGFRKLKGNETGVTLIETLIALAVLGFVAVTFLSGLATTAKATLITDEQATADSLARSQLEHIKDQDYIDYAVPGHGEYELVEAPDSYSIELSTVPIAPNTGQPLQSGQDDGIQRITVVINHSSKLVLTVVGYKADR